MYGSDLIMNIHKALNYPDCIEPDLYFLLLRPKDTVCPFYVSPYRTKRIGKAVILF